MFDLDFVAPDFDFVARGLDFIAPGLDFIAVGLDFAQSQAGRLRQREPAPHASRFLRKMRSKSGG
jgi:hypothetical protein